MVITVAALGSSYASALSPKVLPEVIVANNVSLYTGLSLVDFSSINYYNTIFTSPFNRIQKVVPFSPCLKIV